MDQRNRLTGVREELGGETEWKKVKGLAKEHACVTHGHRQQCGDGHSGRGSRGLEEEGKWGENGDICNCVNNKMKKRREFLSPYSIL